MFLILVFLLNGAVQFLMLLGAQTISYVSARHGRLLLSAAGRSLYCVLCMLPGLSFLGKLFWQGIAVLLTCWTAFGIQRNSIRCWGLYSLFSIVLGCTASLVKHSGFLPLAASAALIWLLIFFSDGKTATVPVEITGDCGTIRLTALRDNGNSLRDPVSGEQVLVIGQEAAKTLTGLTDAQLRSPLAALPDHPGLRLIPFSAVGVEQGMLLAKRFSKVTIGTKTASHVVAFAPQTIGGEDYQALAGGIV